MNEALICNKFEEELSVYFGSTYFLRKIKFYEKVFNRIDRLFWATDGMK